MKPPPPATELTAPPARAVEKSRMTSDVLTTQFSGKSRSLGNAFSSLALTLQVRFAETKKMNWLGEHSAAVQAIASIVGVIITAVLAGITYWYTRVTRSIAESSVEQARLMRQAAELSQQQAKQHKRQLARTIAVLAQRSRVGLEAVPFSHAAMRAYTQPTDTDINDIERIAREIGNDRILASANRAVTSLRSVLSIVLDAKSVKPEIGWVPGPERRSYWDMAVTASIDSLKEIETEAQTIFTAESGI
jgi:hypothetical protein